MSAITASQSAEAAAPPDVNEARAVAADLLRHVRRCPWHEVEQPLRWAISYLPESRPIWRLKIKWLIEQDDLDAAEALLARALQKNDDDPGLRTLAAHCQLKRGRPHRAEQEIHRAMQQRPNHRRTAYLAGEIAAALGRFDEAITITKNTLPDHDEHDPEYVAAARRQLVLWMIQTNQLDEAEKEIHQSTQPMPIAQARLHQARGRIRDAEHVVSEALRLTKDSDKRDALLTLRFELIEATADKQALLAMLDDLDAHTPQAVVQAGLALLAFGEFSRAVSLLQGLLPHLPRGRRRVQHVLTVATATAGDVDQAESLLEEIESVNARDSDLIAECWRRAMLGRLLREQAAATDSAQTMHTSQLRSLLIDALAVLQSVSQNEYTPTHETHDNDGAMHTSKIATCMDSCQQLLNNMPNA